MNKIRLITVTAACVITFLSLAPSSRAIEITFNSSQSAGAGLNDTFFNLPIVGNFLKSMHELNQSFSRGAIGTNSAPQYGRRDIIGGVNRWLGEHLGISLNDVWQWILKAFTWLLRAAVALIGFVAQITLEMIHWIVDQIRAL